MGFLTTRRGIALLIVGLGSLVMFVVMRPDLMLTANTPTGGDMGAHVFLPAFLRDTLLPQGRIMGWSNDWYAGFPALYFYFPLPALAIVALDVVLPYGVAFKLITASGIIALPAASYALARAMGFSRMTSSLGGVAGGTYVFMESHEIWGGNIKATMAGEFSFSIALALGVLYLASVIKASREGRGFTPMAGVLLALTALSHLIVVIVVVVASLPLLIRRRGSATVVGSWLLGLAIAGFWAIPLVLRLGYTFDMQWDPVTGADNLWPREFWPVLALGIAGFAWALIKNFDVVPAAWLAIVPAAGYLAIPVLDFTKVYNARLLPFYYYTFYLFAGLGVGMAVALWARRVRTYRPDVLAAMWLVGSVGLVLTVWKTGWLATNNLYLPIIAVPLGLLAVMWTNIGTTRQAAAMGAASLAGISIIMVGILSISDAPGWVEHNYTGYEGRDAFDEYAALIETVDELPDGRIQWEANSDLGRYGTPMALMLLPYWTEGSQDSMEGLYFESSITTPVHFLNTSEVSARPSNPARGLNYRSLNFERASEHLPFSGIDYYVSFTDQATEEAGLANFEVLAESDPFTIFAAPHSELVEIAAFETVVYDGDRSFREAALEWYDRVDELDRWMVADGPDDWPKVDDVAPASIGASAALPSLIGVGRPLEAGGELSNIELTDNKISFTTTAIGVPHLIKVSDFPNWEATGAEGPYPAAPSFMIVVPTEANVEINFVRTWDEWLGIVATLGGIVLAIGWGRLRRSSRAGRFAA
ncbi:MAG: hypothetical protein OES13_08800 [Acidimicrobiia bacterium]|nr:hypothetical protein [Acidimicrobiia bacterium]